MADGGISFEDAMTPNAGGGQSQGISFEDAMQPQQAGPQEGVSFEDAMQPQPESSALGAGARSFARTLIPNAIGAIAGVATAAGLAPEVSPFVSVPAGFAAAGATTYAAQRVQDELTDKLGITSEDQRQADAAQHPTATTVGELATAIPTFGFGAEAALAKRALSGGIVGSANLVQQGITKGPENIDPTEALTAAGVGAALPNVRPWAEAAAAPLQRGVTKAVQSGLGRGWGGGSPPGGADVNPSAEAVDPALRETQRADAAVSKETSSPAPGTAAVHTPAPDSDTTAPPGTTDLNAKPNEGMTSVRSDRDYPKGQAPKGAEVPGAPATPLEITDPAKGGMSDSMADTIRGQQGEGPNAQINEKAPPQPPPPAPPPEQNPQAAQPAMPQAPGQEDLTIPTGLRRNPNPDVYKLPEPGLEPTPKAPPEGQNGVETNPVENPLYRSSPETQARTDELARTSAANADADQQSFKDRIAKIVAARKAGQEKPPEAPQYTDKELDDLIEQQQKPQSLSAAAPPNTTYASAQTAIQKSKIGSAIKDFGPVKWFRQVFGTGLTDSGNKFDTLVREGQGTINTPRLQYEQKNLPLERAINNTDGPSRDEFVRTYQDGQVPSTNPLSRLASQAHEQQRYYDKQLAQVDPEGDFQRNQLPSLFEDRLGAKNFVIDWKDNHVGTAPPRIGDFMDAGFKLRPDLTRLKDGMPDPVKVMQTLHGGYDSFLEGKDIVNKAINRDGLFFDNEVPGTVPMKYVTKNGNPVYAEPEVAMMADRYFDPNRMDPTSKDFLTTMQKAKNATTAFQMIGGGYHVVAETSEAVTGDIMRAISQAAAGRYSEAGRKLVGAPLAPFRQAFKSGPEAMKEFYNPGTATAEIQKAVEIANSVGITPKRIQRYTPELNVTRGFFEGWQKAANQMDLQELGAQTRQGPLGAGKSAFQLLGKGMQTVMEPLFNEYIPRLKYGAAIEQIADYVAANPDKAHLYQEMAKRISKSTEDRLGELNQSTLFWNNTLKKAANLLMISPGWEVGTIRAAVGGMKSLLTNPARLSITHPDFQPNAAWPFAFAVTTAAIGSIYQFLKTGELPKDVKDPFFPRTGGKANNSQQPERAILPGYLKDVYGAWNSLTGTDTMPQAASKQLYNKLAMLPRSTWYIMANKDWSGHQIANPNDPLYQRMQQYLGYVQKNMVPITAKQISNNPNPKSNISTGEAAFGLRHAPGGIEKPAEADEGARKANQKAAEEAKKFHAKGY